MNSPKKNNTITSPSQFRSLFYDKFKQQPQCQRPNLLSSSTTSNNQCIHNCPYHCVYTTNDCHPPYIVRTKYHKTPSSFEMFCDLSSIRGVQKIYKSKSTFIRGLWIIFVISMTFLLMFTSVYLVLDYLTYSTSWHSQNILDDKTEFPAITLCAHNPFSLDVNYLWSNHEVPTPFDIQVRLKQLLTTMLKHGINQYTGDLAFSDSMEFYYANLKPQDAYRVGHKTDMFYHCMLYEEGTTIVAEKCDLETETTIHVKRFSHPKYFNCYTLDAKPNSTTADITRLIILIRLVPHRKIHGMNNMFVMDTFTRGEGIKMLIHEQSTYPDIDKVGFNIQPGRMNEITYKTVLWKRLPTPVQPCRDEQIPIQDLGINYTYRLSQCFDMVLQKELMQRCRCLNSEWPRPIESPNLLEKIPYCQKLPENETTIEGMLEMKDRLDCFRSVISNLKQLKENAVKSGLCVPLCVYYTYDAELSVTSWAPDLNKLEHYTKGYRYVDHYLRDPHRKEYIDNILAHFTHAPETNDTYNNNATKIPKTNDEEKYNNTPSYFEDGTHTYISLIRQNFDTSVKEERLVLDANILLSRIGGLCSLCIGLTTSFFIELIEFIYLRIRSYKQISQQPITRNRLIKWEGENDTVSLQYIPNGAGIKCGPYSSNLCLCHNKQKLKISKSCPLLPSVSSK